MDAKARILFVALIAAQAAHSVEEYATGLFDVFAPARFVSNLISDDLSLGFALANMAVVLFGLWCVVARVWPRHPSAPAFAWFWAIVEFGNGFGHSAMALARGGYFPGAATAPALLGLSGWLALRLAANYNRER